MGLDQLFYKKAKQKEDGTYSTDGCENNVEIMYFRKYWELHRQIERIIGKTIENGTAVRIQGEHLKKMVEFIRTDRSYWAFTGDDDMHYDLSENGRYAYVLGVFRYYMKENDEIYYYSNW